MAEEKEKKTVLSQEIKKGLDDIVNKSMKDADTQFTETCNVGFDLALTNGKGLPRGTSVLFYADPACGKTTLLADVSKRLIQVTQGTEEPFKVLYIASEGSKELLKKIGLGPYMESGDFIYVEKSLCWRNIETFYEAVLQGYKNYKGVKLIIIDSINNILSDQNQVKSVADGDFGTKARERTSFYAKYLPRCSEAGVSTFLIAPVRQKPEAGMYEVPKKAGASFPDLHSVEIVVKCGKKQSKTETKKVVTKTVFGEVKEQKRYIMTLNSSAGGCKNRFFQGTPSEVMVVRGEGIDNTYAIRMILEANGYIKKSGGYYSIPSEDLCNLMNEACPDLGLKAGTNYRLSAINNAVKQCIGVLIDMLKNANQYKLEVSEEEVDEDEDEDDE